MMYATDAKALALCSKVLYHTYHRMITPLQAIFMPCLVLTHSEEYHHQVSDENSTAKLSFESTIVKYENMTVENQKNRSTTKQTKQLFTGTVRGHMVSLNSALSAQR